MDNARSTTRSPENSEELTRLYEDIEDLNARIVDNLRDAERLASRAADIRSAMKRVLPDFFGAKI